MCLSAHLEKVQTRVVVFTSIILFELTKQFPKSLMNNFDHIFSLNAVMMIF